jgi:hypothetical protein
LQVVQSAGGLSLHEVTHEAERPVAVHFGGRSLAVSVTSDSFPQQIGAEAGQSAAVEHASVAFEGQELALPHAFI